MVKGFRLKIVLMSLFCLLFFSIFQIARVWSSDLLFVLDCSGSMWERVDGQPKILIAKNVLTDLLGEVPDSNRLGLLAYGHRKKGDCEDIALISAMGSSSQDVIQQLSTLNARGKTPIEKAFIQAFETLAGQDSDQTVVLISDGIETCGGDPCSYIKTANARGIELKIHVVGFQVSGPAAEQLQCIAKAGNGGYFSAGNTIELKNALQQIKANIIEKTPLPAPPEVVEVETREATSKKLKLAGPGTVTLKPAPWVAMPPRYWSLVDAETGEEVSRSSDISTRVKPGEYQLVWRQNEHQSTDVMLTSTVTVDNGQKVDLPVDTGLRITLPQMISPPKWWGLDDPDTGESMARFSGPMISQVVPAGWFTLVWRQTEHEATTVPLGVYEIKSGELNDIVLDMGFYIQRADWVPRSFYYVTLIDQQGKVFGKWRNVTAQLAPPGDYTVVIRPTEHNNNDIAWSAITIPDHGFADVSIDSGIKFIHEPDAKPPYQVIFINLDTNAEIVIKESWSSLPLPPGRYRIDWWESQHESERQTLMEEFELEAGTVLEFEI